jgi:hypothetical protein
MLLRFALMDAQLKIVLGRVPAELYAVRGNRRSEKRCFNIIITWHREFAAV